MRKFITDILAKANLGVEQNAYVLGTVGIGTSSASAKLDISVTPSTAWMNLINGDETAFRLTTYNNGTSSGSAVYAFKHGLYYGTTENAAVTFYRGGSGVGGFLTFTTNNGAERMRIDSDGNVGIGTTSPAVKLEVIGVGSFNNAASSRKWLLDATNGVIQHNYNGTVETQIGFSGGTTYFLWQNVGIGTTSPSSILQLGAGSYTATNSSYNSFNAGGFGVLFRDAYDSYLTFNTVYGASGWVNKYSSYKSAVINLNDGALDISTGTGTTAGSASNLTSRLTMTNVGDVGIGTTSPAYKLQVVGEIYTNYRVQINDGTANLIIGHWDGVNTRIENSGGRPLLITSYSQPINMSISGSGPAFSLKADSNAYFTGSLGVGTTSPGAKLDVVGKIAGGSSSETTNAFSGVNNSLSQATIYSYNYNASGWSIYSAQGINYFAGNVGIGTTSPGYRLDVNGTGRFIGVGFGSNGIQSTGANGGNGIYTVAGGSAGSGVYAFTNDLSSFGGTFEHTGAGQGIALRVIGYSTFSQAATFSSSVTAAGTGGRTVVLQGGGAGRIDINGDGATYATGIAFNSQLGGTALSGIWNYGSGTTQIWMSLGGTSYDNGPVFIKANGNVGIGTYNTDNYAASGRRILSLNGSSNTMLEFKVADSSYAYIYRDSRLEVYDANRIDLSTNTAVRATINSSGNVGIGTTSPSYKLDVSGVVRSTSDIIGSRFYTPDFVVPSSAKGLFNNTNYSGPAWNNASFVTGNGATGVMMGGDAALYSYGWIQGVQTDNGATKGLFLNPLGGNVNIGGAAIFSSTITASNYYASNGGFFGWGDSSTRVDGDSSNQYIRAVVNNSEKLRIAPSGNVGIGTSSPAYKLDVNGTGYFGGSVLIEANETSLPLFYAKQTGTSGYTAIQFSGNNGTDIGALTTYNGQIYFGSWNGGNGSSGQLQINKTTGAATFSSSVTASSFGGNSYPYNSILGSGADASTGTIFAGSTSGYASSIDVAGGGAANPNTIIFKTASTEKMRITSGGDVLVGTTTSIFANANRGVVQVNGGLTAIFALTTGGTDSGYLYHTGTDMLVWNTKAGYVAIGTNNSEKMRVTSGGNVGIGTTSPSELLEVVGNIRANISNGGGFMLTGASASGLVRAGATGLALRTNTTDRLTVDNNGNVGIGTTSPDSKLQITSSGSNIFRMVRSQNNFGFEATSTSSGGYGLYDYQNSAYDLYLQAGKVGIGTTNPYEALDINGNIRLGNYPTSGTRYIGYGNNTFADQFIAGMSIESTSLGGVYSQKLNFVTHHYGVSAAIRMTIDEDGRVGIGTTSPGAKLHIGESGAAAQLWLQRTDGYNPVKLIGGTLADGNGFKITMNTTDAFSITSAGNVGIGTTAPTGKLEILGSDNQLILNTAGTYSSIYFRNNGNNVGQLFSTNTSTYLTTIGARTLYLGGGNATQQITLDGTNVGIGTTSPAYKLDIAGTLRTTNSALLGDSTTVGNSSFAWGFPGTYYGQMQNVSSTVYGIGFGATPTTIGTTVLSYNTSGNVGIGTTSPAQRLDVRGFVVSDSQGNASESAFYLGNSAHGLSRANLQNDIALYTTSGDVRLSGNTASTTHLIVKNSGNVGIGITTPNSTLQVSKGGVTFQVTDTNKTANNTFSVYGLTQTSWAIATGNSGSFSGGEKIVITDNGNVGIGTTSPGTSFSELLQVSKSDVGRISVTHTNTTGSRQSDILFTEGATLQFQVGTILGNGGYDDQNWIRGVANIPLTFFTNSTERMRITSGGNVGIGTTSPASRLEVGNFLDAFTNSITVSGRYEYVPQFTFRLGQSGTNLDWTGGVISCGDDGNYNGIIYFKTANAGRDTPTTKMVIKANGNVGIGTTSPSQKLEVAGNILSDRYYPRSSNNTYISGDTGGLVVQGSGYFYVPASGGSYFENTVRFRGTIINDSNTYLSIGGGTSGNTYFSGNVGIGTTSPSTKLTVSDTNTITNQIDLIGYSSSAKGHIGEFANNLYISTNYFYNGAQNADNSSLGQAAVVLSAGSTTTSFIDFNLSDAGANNPNVKVRIISNGNVGIGTTSPSYKLHVEGNVSGISIYASHDIAAFSDITVKKEVKKIENAIEKVKELNGYTYVRTDDETGTRRAGVIAQEVQKVLPEVVSANPDGTLNVAYSNMIALLIEGMKEQQATIERLENRIKILEK